ncbi:hypothetical protein, partial [Escherichia coli]|uniref:hypothetical protein n=1 Tax=Escherichia coli TaxID=562 RepID=UPI0015C30E2E
VQVYSEQFGTQQVSRHYPQRGRILQVPPNNNPHTPHYSGISDRASKPSYRNNMAGRLRDMLTHPRFGFGTRRGAAAQVYLPLYVIRQSVSHTPPPHPHS